MARPTRAMLVTAARVVLVMLPAAALQALLPGNAGGLIMLPVVGATAAYQWFIARTALRITGVTAAGIVGFDFALSLFIAAIAADLRGV